MSRVWANLVNDDGDFTASGRQVVLEIQHLEQQCKRRRRWARIALVSILCAMVTIVIATVLHVIGGVEAGSIFVVTVLIWMGAEYWAEQTCWRAAGFFSSVIDETHYRPFWKALRIHEEPLAQSMVAISREFDSQEDVEEYHDLAIGQMETKTRSGSD